MKHLMLLVMTISYSVVSFAGYDDMALDASIEAETAFSSSEEARVEADELKRMAKEEKKRKDALKEASIKSAKDAKSLELQAAREAERSRNEKEVIGKQVKEIQGQLKATEARKVAAQKRINYSKAEIANFNKVHDEYKAKIDASNKELALLQNEATTFEKYVREAQEASVRAQKEAFSTQKQVKDTQASNDKARAEAQKRVERYRAREAHYQAMADKNKGAARGISSESPATPYGQ
jgi:chromosome segregation ATPase